MASDLELAPFGTAVMLPAAPPFPPSQARRGRKRLAITLAVSLAVHALILCAFLFLRAGRPAQDVPAPSDVSMVFEAAGDKSPPSASPEGKSETPAESDKPGAPPPTPEEAPDTSQLAPPPELPAPAPPTPVVPPTQTLPVPEAAPTPVTPPAAPPAAQALPPEPASPIPAIPLPPSPALDAVPVPPPPAAAEAQETPQPPQPQSMPRPTPRTAPRPAARAPSRTPSRTREAPGSSLSSPMNYSLGGAAKGLRHSNPFASMPTNLPLGTDWKAALRRWVQQHGYYPREAAMRGEDGPVTLQLTINRFGIVTDVQMVESSGSQALDAAWQSVWRGARVPPFPPGTQDDSVTITYTGNYILRR